MRIDLSTYSMSKADFNKLIGFKCYEEDEVNLIFMIFEDYIVDLFSGNDFGLEDIEIEELNKHKLNISVSLEEYFKHYKQFIISQNISMFEEIYMHQDNIERNIKKLGYINQMQLALTNKRIDYLKEK